MKLYQIKSGPPGSGRLEHFLKENYVALSGGPLSSGIHESGKAERLTQPAAASGNPAEELREIPSIPGNAEPLASYILFTSEMKDGDFILLDGGEYVHLGDIGEYFYDDSPEASAAGTQHRRGVTWLSRIPKTALGAQALELVSEPADVSAARFSWEASGLARWLPDWHPAAGTAAPADHDYGVDPETIVEALEVLKQALRSDCPDRRVRAAAAILHYAQK